MIKGVDVSSYQSSTYSTSGLDFAIVKATEGTSYINPKQSAQAKHGRSAGLVIGFYHFLHPGNPKGQAAYFVEKCASVEGDVLACDWEPSSDGTPSNADKDAFLKETKRLRPGHQVILYCDVARWTGVDKTSYCCDGLWIAQYNGKPGSPSIQHAWVIHQYTSDPIDTNVADFADRAAMRAWAQGDGNPPEDDMPVRTSLGKSKDQKATWNDWTVLDWDVEHADPENTHTKDNPGYVAPTSSWADFNGRLVVADMEEGDQVQVRYEVHEWKDGKSAGTWSEIVSDQYATPGQQFVSVPFSKGLTKGEHVYVSVKVIPASGREDAAAPKVTSGRWAIRQDK